MGTQRSRLLLLPLLLTAMAPAACSSRNAATSEPTVSARTEAHPEFDLGAHSWKVTGTPDAQRWFNHGQRWMYAFNHDEAVRAFTRATELDPSCAMAWWGIALCKGPHINNPAMDEASCRAAWSALAKAQACAASCTPVERALIRALASRYADPGAGPLPLDQASRAPLDRAYAEAMGEVHEQFPEHDEVAVLYAEALMDLRPWDLWSLDGQPRPETPRILGLLESVLKRDPRHPGANHYYIHSVEASPMLEPARRALRVYVLTELHQVLRSYERSIAEADVVLTRTSHRGEVCWAVACTLTLPDGSRIDLGGTGSRVHAAVDEMTLEAWRS
ncbi:MAG TPA: hypothetical protein PK308_04325, partial [Phycisphaerales bacterium]|nr:hypothetical protein [Phycisphaerales bacterium]